MKTNKSILAMAATASILGIGAGIAKADTIASFNATQKSPLVTFTGDSGGVLSVPDAGNGGVTSSAFSPTDGQFLNTVFTFGPVGVTGSAVTALGTTSELLSGGSFAIKNGATTYLSGTFTQSTLDGNLPTTSASVMNFGATSVTYTGGLFLTDAGFNAGDMGTFSLSMSGLIPGLTLSGSPAYFNSFTVGSTTKAGGLAGTFDVTPRTTVPEPASVIPFALGGLGLLGLIVRKTRRTNGAAA